MVGHHSLRVPVGAYISPRLLSPRLLTAFIRQCILHKDMDFDIPYVDGHHLF